MNQKKILGLLLLLSLGACDAGDNQSSVQILGRALSTSDTECSYKGGGEMQLGGGTLDVSAEYGAFLTYALPLYVNNELADPADTSSAGVTAAKTWYAQTARVRVNPAAYINQFGPNPALLPFHAENVIPLDGHGIPVDVEDVVWVEAVSRALGVAFQGQIPAGESRQVVLGITIQGKTADGRALDTGEFYYPIEVCSGCLSPVPACADPNVLRFSCGGPGQDTAPVCAAP
jgi:hypothetical protein